MPTTPAEPEPLVANIVPSTPIDATQPRPPTMIRSLLVVLVSSCTAAASELSRPRALLVGAGDSVNADILDLDGAPNGVELVGRVLVDRLGFDGRELVLLRAAAKSYAEQPTRDSILRGLDSLASSDHAGELVAVFLSGHGTRVPYLSGDEIDGYDEAFLPSDAESWERDRADGAIVDDELDPKLDAIAASGGRIWLTVDSCFSASPLPGSEETIHESSKDAIDG